ncbi:hypothetical protein KO481_02860 [Nocardia sp. NEAU-G5]|uniref:Uncharacterized protein n=1 Tax=Nocardia albiluteola TaxID=2842303 RepID=A0ABS6ATV9_9NOCA|nr:hypothetical protein [Nocardia albiluteola]MBU3060463.1 hypothetical protein [Nocardia albiluteola]
MTGTRSNQQCTITGPEAVSFGDVAEAIDDVEHLTGEPARTFQAYVEETWSASNAMPPLAHGYSTFL